MGRDHPILTTSYAKEVDMNSLLSFTLPMAVILLAVMPLMASLPLMAELRPITQEIKFHEVVLSPSTRDTPLIKERLTYLHGEKDRLEGSLKGSLFFGFLILAIVGIVAIIIFLMMQGNNLSDSIDKFLQTVGNFSL